MLNGGLRHVSMQKQPKLMAKVISFPPGAQQQRFVTSFLAVAPRPNDGSPLTVTISGKVAANIRRAALWAGKPPEQFAADWLSGYIPRDPA